MFASAGPVVDYESHCVTILHMGQQHDSVMVTIKNNKVHNKTVCKVTSKSCHLNICWQLPPSICWHYIKIIVCQQQISFRDGAHYVLCSSHECSQ